MEILPDIHKIDGVTGANSYIILDSKNITLIDTGMPGNAKRILKYIQTLGRSPRDLQYIILTHADIDHAGNALRLKRMSGAQIAAHEYEIANLHGGFATSTNKSLSGITTRMRFLRFRSINVDMILKDADEIAGLKVIHTPGHTSGSICLYRAPDVLFAGDTVRVQRGNNLRFSARVFTWDAAQAYQSVRKIAELPLRVLLPGHGEPLTENIGEKLRELLQTNS